MHPSTLIRRSRQRAGLTQRQLAARAGTSAAAVCLYERGERTPRTDTLARLIAATGATLALDVDWPGDDVDVVANGRTLEELLDLVDHLPQRSAASLPYPAFKQLVA